MKLYITPTSGNAWKVRLLLSMLKQPFETIVLDSKKNELKSAEFLKLNPRGQVPVLVDGAHAFAHFPFTRDNLDCDYYGTSLHKWLSAPFGAGFLYKFTIQS